MIRTFFVDATENVKELFASLSRGRAEGLKGKIINHGFLGVARSTRSASSEWDRVTSVEALEVGAEYYIRWYSNKAERFKNTIAEYTGQVDELGRVAFDHNDVPWGTLDQLKVYVAPKPPVAAS